MFASVQKYLAAPAQIERVLKSRNEIENTISQVDGFLSIYLLKTLDSLTVLTLTKTKESADETSGTILALIKDRVPELAKNPQLSIGEVVFQLSALEAHI